MAMYCKHCMRQIDDNVSYCPNCGRAQFEIPGKRMWPTFILCVTLGGLGMHRFYVGKFGTGLLWLFTFGFFGIGTLVDAIEIISGKFKDNDGNPLYE